MGTVAYSVAHSWNKHVDLNISYIKYVFGRTNKMENFGQNGKTNHIKLEGRTKTHTKFM